MQLTIQDIKDNTDNNYYERGFRYFNAHRVLKCQIEFESETSVILIATVEGDTGTYRQDIDIDKTIGGTRYIEGRCSCPVGHNCKHVVAVCIKYTVDKDTNEIEAQENSFAQISSVDKWLQNLQNSCKEVKQQLEKEKIQSGEYFFTYRLDGAKSHEIGKLRFYKSKILKNGSISKGTKLDGYRAVHSYSYRELKNSDDENILAMASTLYIDFKYGSRDESLSGTLGYLMAKEIFLTNRCYFDSNQTPLKLQNELFHVVYDFKLYMGEYSLKSNLDKKEYRVLETNPPFLIDIKENKAQELDIDIEMYRELCNAPKFDKDEIGKVFTAVSQSAPNIEIHTPKSISTKKIDTQPTPRINLKDNSFKLDFLYEEYSVKYFPRDAMRTFYEENEKVELTKDLVYEQMIKEIIEAFGFKTQSVNNDLYVFLSDDNRQEQLIIWKEFLNIHMPRLKDDGWLIERDEEFAMKFESNSSVVVDSEASNNWFSLSFNLEFNGVSQPIAPLVSSIIAEFDDFSQMPEIINIEVSKNHFVEVSSKQIQPIIKTIVELFDKKDKNERLSISSYDAHLIEFMDDNVIWRGNKEILELSKKLKDFKGIKRAEPPKCLNATLREYQQDGLNWLNFLYEFKFGGILADDMGLGKTVQTLAHISKLKEDSKLTNPTLIVMPTSLIANWKNEAKKFTPNLRVLSLHGDDRAERFDEIEDYDILLTTYPLVVRDQKRLNEYRFFYIILDEAQKIKNPKTKMAIALKTFKSDYRLALSGTPIENHLGELWSIFSFLMPGFLNTLSFFRSYYQTPIEKEHDFERQNILNKRVKPFMIRRTKEKVAAELPEKSEIIKYTQFDNAQSKLYESIRITMEKKVQEAVKQKGLGSSHITILDALLKLRQVCCDPSLLKIEEAQKVQESAKLELLLDLIDELLQEGRRILIFSQFTSMLSIIEEKIKEKEISYTKLTGSTRNREEVIKQFTSGKADVFLISLKAGGVGLNLVEADTVIHYDPWWNPAVENQATDRVYRIGQTKAVFVYKLIVENTIEQKILELQVKKQAIQDGIYESDKQQEEISFSGNELLELLK